MNRPRLLADAAYINQVHERADKALRHSALVVAHVQKVRKFLSEMQ